MKKLLIYILLFLSIISYAQTNNSFPTTGDAKIENGDDLVFPGSNGINNSTIQFKSGEWGDYERELSLSMGGIDFTDEDQSNDIHRSTWVHPGGYRIYQGAIGYPDRGGLFDASSNVIFFKAPSNSYDQPVRELGMHFQTNTYDNISKFSGVGIALNFDDQTFSHLYMTHGSNPWNSTLGINILPNGFTGIGTLSPDTFLEIDAGSSSALIPTGDSGLKLTQLTSSHSPTKGAMPIGVDATGKVVRVDVEGSSGDRAWLTEGNDDIDSSHRLGTINSEPLRIITNDQERLRITTFGRLVFHDIDTTPSTTKNLYIGGGNDPVTLYPAGQNVINTVIGIGSFKANTSGYNNTVLGGNSLYTNTTGSLNTVVGSNSMIISTSGIRNVVLGSDAMTANTSGNFNVALGNGTLVKNTTGDYNVQIGYYGATTGITTGSGNIGIGFNAGTNLTTGSNNIIIGSQSTDVIPVVYVDAPISATESNQLNIGNWIYGHNGQIAIGEFDDLGEAFEKSSDFMLIVKQGIRTERVRVDLSSVNDWSDYVFNNDYNLMPIEQLENYILENKHLPNIPSAAEVLKDGIDLGQMDAKLLEKIEELTLYNIELYKENKTLQEQNKEQEALLNELLKRVEQLESVSK